MRLRSGRGTDVLLDDGWVEDVVRTLARQRYSPPADLHAENEAGIRAAFLTARASDPAPRAERLPVPRPLTDVRRFVRAWSRAFVLAPALLVILVMGTTLASTESAPGHPLFGARLAVEQALLPQHSTAERIAAELDRLDRRVMEATETAGDVDATREATEAYRETLGAVVDLVHAQPDQRDVVERALDRQIAALRTLATNGGSATQASLDWAADAASNAQLALADHDHTHRRDARRQRGAPASHEAVEPTPTPPSR